MPDPVSKQGGAAGVGFHTPSIGAGQRAAQPAPPGPPPRPTAMPMLTISAPGPATANRSRAPRSGAGSWRRAVLGRVRLRTLTIHHGRHTSISHALAGGRTLVEVRAAAGQTNTAVTSIYLPVAVDDEGEVGDLFEGR